MVNWEYKFKDFGCTIGFNLEGIYSYKETMRLLDNVCEILDKKVYEYTKKKESSK